MGVQWEVQLFIDFKKAYDSVRRESLYSILTEFGVPMKLVSLIKMCLNETYSKVRIGKHFLMHFLFRTVWNKEMLYHHCFSSLLWNMPSGVETRQFLVHADDIN
jgi:hypothetical protein